MGFEGLWVLRGMGFEGYGFDCRKYYGSEKKIIDLSFYSSGNSELSQVPRIRNYICVITDLGLLGYKIVIIPRSGFPQSAIARP